LSVKRKEWYHKYLFSLSNVKYGSNATFYSRFISRFTITGPLQDDDNIDHDVDGNKSCVCVVSDNAPGFRKSRPNHHQQQYPRLLLLLPLEGPTIMNSINGVPYYRPQIIMATMVMMVMIIATKA
jgi:hypothetical protein